MTTSTLQTVEVLRDLTQQQVIPHLQATTVYAMLADRDFIGWKNPMQDGTRGEFYRFLTPSYGRTQNTLGVTAASLEAEQNQAYVAADTPLATGFAISDEQLATNPKAFIYDNFIEGKLVALASDIDRVVRNQLHLTGYRWFANGNKTIPDETNTSFPLFTQTLAKWNMYGRALGVETQIVIPELIAPKIIASMQNQFVPVRNDQIQRPGELGTINGLKGFRVYSTNLINKFTVGTVAAKAPVAEIVSVVDSTTAFNATSQFASDSSTITLTGLTDGDEIVVGDLGDIGSAGAVATGQDALKFIRPSDGEPLVIDAQFVVVEGGTVGAAGGNPPGEVSFKVFPRMVADTGSNLDATITRAIVTGATGDKVQFVSRNHFRGSIFYSKFVKFVNAKLDTKQPFPTYAHPLSERMKMTIRLYHGAQLEGNQSITVMDCLIGCRTIPAGVGQILFAAD